jgi:aminopeptidase N
MDPMTTYRKNYTPPPYLIEELELTLALDPAATLVTSRMVVTKNPAATMRVPLQLDRGKGLELVSVKIGNATLEEGDYVLDEDKLSLGDVGDRAIVEIVTRVAPNRNTELEGLYVSNGIFCTQCEAEGFRRITFYPDRPDVMAKMRVRVEGDKAKEPILLAGGNPVEAGDLSDGRHYVIYDDPYPKSAYLFAAVGGDLDFIEDSFTTMSGRTVALKIFVNKGNAGKAGHAMASLKAAMAWDEKVYGREYQLDVFNIVAVHDFNMGAMENTGLNIFNAKYVLADAETATDMDFMNVEGVIAHEYFHNWSGNRVTVRDWFQLSLKEGFTVYRDQEFSADMNDRTVKRIEEVERLMRAQFPEDAGPTAHPIRPDTYEEIQNFYTPTVYEKGAEVVRMMATLQGKDNFRKGTDLYFERHDGQAVTCEDFVKAQEDASGIDLSQFRRWYEQAGTPALTAKTDYNITLRRYTVTLRQETPPTPGQPEKLPVVIPVRLGLLARDGAEILATVATMTEAEQSFAFDDIDEEPVLSLLRDFSAPVKLTYEQDADTLRFLMRYDRDGYNRATAARRLAADALAKLLAANNRHAVLDTSYVHALRDLLAVSDHDPALSAEMLSLPAKTVFAQRYETIDVDGIASAYTHAREQIAKALPTFWRDASPTLPSAKRPRRSRLPRRSTSKRII